MNDIHNEMTRSAAASIAREDAAKHTGDVRAALTMLANFATAHFTPEPADPLANERSDYVIIPDETYETIADIASEMRKLGELDEKSTDKIPRSLMGLGLRTYADRLKAAAKRERELLRSCARWILTHDIYGHMAQELLDECKKVLGDDGNFLIPKGDAE